MRLDLRGQRLGLGDVVDLAAGEAERQGIAQGIGDGMDFRRQPATRAPYGLVETPFFRAPALCWWALVLGLDPRMVAPIIAYSLPGSSAKALKRLFQTPLSAQREKRRWVFFQPPKRSGKSLPTERPSGISRSPPRRTAGCRPRCCARHGRAVPAADSQYERTGRRAIHSASWQSPPSRRLPMNHTSTDLQIP